MDVFFSLRCGRSWAIKVVVDLGIFVVNIGPRERFILTDDVRLARLRWHCLGLFLIVMAVLASWILT
eukprot:SAG11_NODE_2956_length_2812_cov_2.043126_3_plen_67_part_00